MRWRGRQQSGNVEDRRGLTRGGLAVGGGIGGVLLLVVFLLMGGDPRDLNLQESTSPSRPAMTPAPTTPAEDDLKEFVSVVLKDTEDVWSDQFRLRGAAYREPVLVLFSDEVQSACGYAGAAMGPFYCPGDSRVYLDLSFFEDLRRRFGAPGDFAQAYVIAHEVGHHVQSLLGIMDYMESMRGRVSEREFNQLSVRLELQADYLAGVWAHHAQAMKQILDEGDVEEALNAASAIGDDRLQMVGRGRTTPDSFTHGTSAQRLHWFRRGLESGDLSQGDTFDAPAL
jgi:predicted metalloprotease